jgi:CarboxypepD_reg-like domain
MKIRYYIFCVLFFQKITLLAQMPSVLERVISVNWVNIPLKSALNNVAEKGHFELSYNARIFDLDKRITLITNSLTVRETLFQLVGDNYSYQQKGTYLIIKKRDKTKQFISGYISDAKTGKKVVNATVYDTKTLRSTTTDTNGYYNLKVAERSTIVVAQLNYKDTILQITEGSSRFVKLDLDLKTQGQLPNKSVNWGKAANTLANIFISPLQKLNNANVQDSIHRRFQLSFLPYIGTNYLMSGNVINDWSVNAIAGYSHGNRVAEFAGFGNFTRGNIGGFQAAGFSNIVKGNVNGVQAAGFVNYVRDTLKGAQLAGFVNYTHNNNALNQSAGFLNIARNGGLRTQFSGFANIGDSINGVQASGFFNRGNHLKGLQAAGFYNSSKHIKGTQVSGFLNTANQVKGAQIAGFLNTAKHVKGVQISVFNYTDTLDGVQIGVFNYAKVGGYNALELSINELNTYNLAYKSGGRRLYTALIAGFSPKNNATVWTYGAGLGTFLTLNKWSDLNIESLYRQIQVGAFKDNLQGWLQLGAYWNLHLNQRFELVLGPNYNALFMNNLDAQFTENRTAIFPSFIKRKEFTEGDLTTNTWFGGSLGLRIKL